MRRRSATYSFDSRHGSNGIARHPEPLLGGRSASGSTTGDKCFVPAHRKGSRWPGRRPEANHDSCVERFIRTLKENLLWVRRFATIEELRQALHAFKDTYNRTWIVERHGYQTPSGHPSGEACAARRRSMNPQRVVSQLWTATPGVRICPSQTCVQGSAVAAHPAQGPASATASPVGLPGWPPDDRRGARPGSVRSEP